MYSVLLKTIPNQKQIACLMVQSLHIHNTCDLFCGNDLQAYGQISNSDVLHQQKLCIFLLSYATTF